jgi:F0F1-type ATP synthase membrane subunit b/b'
MGILDPLKKLLFGVKSVTKHQAEEAIDYTKEKSSDLFDKTIDMMKDAGQKIGATGAKVLDKVDDLWEKKMDSTTPNPDSNESSPFHSSTDFVEPIRQKMDKVSDKVADTFSKVSEKAKDLGSKAVDASDDFWKKAEAYSENVVEKAKSKGTEIFEKAKTVAEEQGKALNQKIDEFIAKEKAIEAKEPKGDFADTPITENKNLTEPLMKKHEDFFDKAKKFLEDADKRTNPKPVDVTVKKVDPAPPTSTPPAEKPLAPQDQKQINDLLASTDTIAPKDDHIEDADIVDDAPSK